MIQFQKWYNVRDVMKFILVLLSVLMLFGGVRGNVQNDFQALTKEESEMYLTNTYYKLTQDKKLNIAYIGGSVTDGYGSSSQATMSWAFKTTNWFQKQYPDARINGTKLSIGGTGSYLASFRFEREIKPTNPDLLFIEYAVNDRYCGRSYEECVRTAETLVHKAYNANPYMDIIFILVFDEETATSDYDALRAHRDVAEKYGILSIKMSEHFYSMLKSSHDNYYEYFTDGVHPNDNGYAYYASVITGIIKNCLDSKRSATELVLKTLPSDTLSSETIMTDATMIYSNEIPLENSNGWNHEKSSFSWLGQRYNGRIYANEPGAKITYEFYGTDFGLCYGIGHNMGVLSCTVDGVQTKAIYACSNNTNPSEAYVAWDLPYGHHTVTLELLSSDANGKCEFELGAFLVN
jgi:lysophospholipase L1-like esterase